MKLLPLAPKPKELVPPSQWTCPQCTLINEPGDVYCDACQGPKPDEEVLQALNEDAQAPAQQDAAPAEEAAASEGSPQLWKALYRDRKENGIHVFLEYSLFSHLFLLSFFWSHFLLLFLARLLHLFSLFSLFALLHSTSSHSFKQRSMILLFDCWIKLSSIGLDRRVWTD